MLMHQLTCHYDGVKLTQYTATQKHTSQINFIITQGGENEKKDSNWEKKKNFYLNEMNCSGDKQNENNKEKEKEM